MKFLCSQINNGYIANLKYIYIPFHKKYIAALLKLYELNLIGCFYIEK